MTNEERAGDIAWLKEVLDGSYKIYGGPEYSAHELRMFAITLASLEAEVKATLTITGGIHEWERLAVLPDGEHDFYTAPPVACLELPDEIEVEWTNENMDDVSIAEQIGFNNCLTEVKRLNGVKP